MIFLDTNTVIAILNNRPAVAQHRLIETVDAGEQVAISTIILFELRYGAARSARLEENTKRIDDFLGGPVQVYPFDADDAAEAAILRAALAARGTPIGPFDLLIAAQARRRNASIVTANKREFERVEGLKVLDWSS